MTSTFTSLHVPVEDTMEMSSPTNRVLDEDIDIDFGDYSGGVQLTDDERMMDDNEQLRPDTATDERMEEDEQLEETMLEEDPMQDYPAPLNEDQEDELIDYGDEEYEQYQQQDVFHNQPVDLLVEESQQPQQEVMVTDPEQLGDVINGEPQATVGLDAPPEQTTHIDLDGGEVAEGDVTEGLENLPEPLAAGHALGDSETVEASPDLSTAPVDASAIAAGEQADTEEPAPSVVDISPEPLIKRTSPPTRLNTSVSFATEAPGTPTDTGLHPMTVRYGDMTWPLFKSRKQPEGLLKDDNLASVSLDELMKNCRRRLGPRLGEDVSEDQEFLLGFDNLGLMMVEDCRASFETSLDDVLQVYLHLYRNDESQEIPPLLLTLSLQLKFASSFNMLKQAAADGQGMSTFAYLHAGEADEDADGEEYGDEYEETSQDEDYLEHQEEFDQANHSTGEFDTTGEPVAEGDEAYNMTHDEAAEDGYQHEQYHEDQEYADDGQVETDGHVEQASEPQVEYDAAEDAVDYELQEETEEVEAPFEGSEAAITQESVAADTAPADAEDHGDQTADLVHATNGDDEEDGGIEASTASSTTLRGDTANEVAGEYDDLIDWDDDSLIDYSSEIGTEPHDEFNTSITEPDDKSRKGEDDSSHELQAQQDHVQEAQALKSEVYENVGGNAQNQVEDASAAAQDDGHHPAEDSDTVGDDQLYEDDLYDGNQDETLYEDCESADDAANASNEQQTLTELDDNGQDDGFSAEIPYEHGLEHYPDVDETASKNGVASHHDDGKPTGPATIDLEDEDDIGFDDETTEQHEARKRSMAGQDPASASPLGKRSFEEHDAGFSFDEEPDLKKIRSS